jgi:hypothetical protein
MGHTLLRLSSRFAVELAETLGVDWKTVTNGMADLAGVTDTQHEAFSIRRSQIDAAMAQAGPTSVRAAQVATLSTRPARPDPVEPETQRREWPRLISPPAISCGKRLSHLPFRFRRLSASSGLFCFVRARIAHTQP